MRIVITETEARVIGSLMEKETTTPDQYPLSLAALTAACNQKSNRNPVMQLSEADVESILQGLMKKHLVNNRTGFGSRVTKYQHRFCNQGFGSLEFSSQERAVLCVLLLRGPQTPGELRSRTSRLCDFTDVAQTESVLHSLMERKEGAFVVRLEREPGKRESRYAHTFFDTSEYKQPDRGAPPPPQTQAKPDRIDLLEATVTQLQSDLNTLEARLDALESKDDAY